MSLREPSIVYRLFILRLAHALLSLPVAVGAVRVFAVRCHLHSSFPICEEPSRLYRELDTLRSSLMVWLTRRAVVTSR